MKLRNLRIERSPRLMIIPMIDIIFFLLVFFMMSTLYMNEQRMIPITLPAAATAAKQIPDQPVIIVIDATGKIHLNKQEIAEKALSEAVGRELMLHPDAPFILRADQAVEYGRVIALLDELKQIGVKKVSFATEGKK
ncbi:MAG: biopolymer transporter ExbD [Sporomusaceae bacterium]|nr:biopolymer transporter ExbD [Sporomusaceae bacterium]